MEPIERVAELVKDAFGHQPYRFVPCAYYDPEADFVILTARDCSLLEAWSDGRLHLFVNSFGADEGYPLVAFRLDTAKAVARSVARNADGRIALTDLLDALERKCPSIPAERLAQARALVSQLAYQSVDIPAPSANP